MAPAVFNVSVEDDGLIVSEVSDVLRPRLVSSYHILGTSDKAEGWRPNLSRGQNLVEQERKETRSRSKKIVIFPGFFFSPFFKRFFYLFLFYD